MLAISAHPDLNMTNYCGFNKQFSIISYYNELIVPAYCIYKNEYMILANCMICIILELYISDIWTHILSWGWTQSPLKTDHSKL